MTTDQILEAADKAATKAADALTAVFGEASPSTVFSRPEQAGEDLIITAVAWERAGGFGFGGGGGEGDGEDGTESGGGAGAGGGGASEGRPVAVIRITPTDVEVKPVIDFTKVGITVLLALIGLRRAFR